MALLYWNKESLHDQAIIWFKDSSKKKINIEYHDTYTLIKEGNEIVGINIKKASSFLKLSGGAQAIGKENIQIIKEKFNLDFSNINISTMLVFGEIINIKKHPKTQKLFILTVKADKIYCVVTNIKNLTVGSMIILAKIGAILPSGTVIKESSILGVKSQGMLCGEKTLGLKATKKDVYNIANRTAGEEFVL